VELSELLRIAQEKEAADIFIVPGTSIGMRIGGLVKSISEERILPDEAKVLITQIYEQANNRSMDLLNKCGDDDFSFSMKQMGRFRCNTFKQRGSLAAVLRLVAIGLPDPSQLNIPEQVLRLADYKKGIVLVTGSAGSGKSTTLACLIDKINSNRYEHIITLEDPIEFLHPHKKSIVSQREVPSDSDSYEKALRAALRQSPNVILLGEMRDHETISTALSAAETGELVFSTLHTIGAAQTVDRIVDAFPAGQQTQIKMQLSMALRAVVSQQLLPTTDGKLVPAFEVMIVNPAIQNMIRDGKMHQVENVIYASAADGMQTMDGDILKLYKEGRITRETALLFSINPEMQQKRMNV
jgi:pilus retraction protein PilT